MTLILGAGRSSPREAIPAAIIPCLCPMGSVMGSGSRSVVLTTTSIHLSVK
mgnify:CR=1 FL=1